MRWVAAIAMVLAFALVAPSPALAAPPPYYPPVEYGPSSRANYDVRGTAHRDPGPAGNGNYYMSLVNACSWQRAQPVARAALRTVANQGYVPSAGLEFDDISDEVLLLQWDLAYLGFVDPDEVAGGGSHFGPLTEEALAKFQQSMVLPPTGSYDELTASALVQALLAAPADVPVTDLEMEAESDDVARLQTVLQRLGHTGPGEGDYGRMNAERGT